MAKINDIDLSKWKESDVWTESLWLVPERDKSGKHDGFYHGNFIPQIPYQLMMRYTKKGDTVFDPFIGSGTTAFEAEKMDRNVIGIDINNDMIDGIHRKTGEADSFTELIHGDSTDKSCFDNVKKKLKVHNRDYVQLAILHPPYHDIIKFTDMPNDLSNAKTIDDFMLMFRSVLQNTIEILEPQRYLAIVIGDQYTNGEWVPLGFYCMKEAMDLGLILKSIIVKDMHGNRGKKNQNSLWKYRALSSDYYIFKHEYIMLMKKGEKK